MGIARHLLIVVGDAVGFYGDLAITAIEKVMKLVTTGYEAPSAAYECEACSPLHPRVLRLLI